MIKHFCDLCGKQSNANNNNLVKLKFEHVGDSSLSLQLRDDLLKEPLAENFKEVCSDCKRKIVEAFLKSLQSCRDKRRETNEKP